MRAAAGVGTVTERTVEVVEPTEKSLVAWDHKLKGFGVRVHHSGSKFYMVHKRSGGNSRRVTIDQTYRTRRCG